MLRSRRRQAPARWLITGLHTLGLLACAGDIAQSQHATTINNATVTSAPPALTTTSAAPIVRDVASTTADPDEPAADVAVIESEAITREPMLDDIERAAATEIAALDGAPPIPPRPMTVPIAIDDADGRSLVAFHAALNRAAAGEGKARILFYGASHVASDLFTGRIRQTLQARFGDAGPGFVMPGKPWPYYRHTLIEHVESRGWLAPRVRARHPIEGRFGLAGVVLEASDRIATAKLHTRSAGTSSGNVSQLELMYWKQPSGGRVQIVIDGQPAAMLSTAGNEGRAAYFQLTVTDGPHDIGLHTFADGPVAIFGMTMEREQPGVILDTVGIPGARARYHLLWDDALYREHVSHRAPDLIVLAYGTNEAGDKDVPIEDYEQELRDVVGRLRSSAPNASCLLIGPSDRPERLSDGSYIPRERVPQIVEAQRRTARALGCGFYDLVAFMGGPMSMVFWASANPPFGAPDHVHYTRRGYEALGDALVEALLAGYVNPSARTATANSMR